jgi:HAD superfamily hydrolase (TIGR01549 family)
MAENYYKNMIHLKDGAGDLIKKLFYNNIKLGIGSSSSKYFVEIILNKYSLDNFFESIRVSCEVERGKPHPDVYLKVAEDLKVMPEECLVFEDTEAGVIAGKRAGMKVCAIADRYSRKYWHKIRGIADNFIMTFRDITI